MSLAIESFSSDLSFLGALVLLRFTEVIYTIKTWRIYCCRCLLYVLAPLGSPCYFTDTTLSVKSDMLIYAYFETWIVSHQSIEHIKTSLNDSEVWDRGSFYDWEAIDIQSQGT